MQMAKETIAMGVRIHALSVNEKKRMEIIHKKREAWEQLTMELLRRNGLESSLAINAFPTH